MVITQKITSLAFEIHDGKTSVCVRVCLLSLSVCASILFAKHVTEVKMVYFSFEFPKRSHGHVPVLTMD